MASVLDLSGGALPLRRAAWSVPEWPWIVLVTSAWALLATHEVHGRGLGSWVIMVVAMMLPATLPLARLISLQSLWNRRYRSAAIFLAAYVAVWTAFGAVALVAWSLSGADGALEPATATAALLLVSAVWLLTDRHRLFLRRCHRLLPIRPRGWRADRSCLVFGAYHARQCVGTCWPLMLAMVPAHAPALMVGLAAVTSWERLARVPRRRACASALVVLAALAFVL